WRPSPETQFKLLGIVSRDRLMDWFDSGRTGTIVSDTEFHRGILEASWQPSRDAGLDLVASGGVDRHRRASFDLRGEKFQVRPSGHLKIQEDFTVAAGVDYMLERPTGWVDASAVPTGALVPGSTGVSRRPLSSIAGHVQANWKASPEIEIVPGLRVES